MVDAMPMVRLNSGCEMPQVGLGTWKATSGVVRGAVLNALRCGYRHIDCAAVYENEREVGEAIREAIAEGIVDRESLFITSKLWNTHHAAADVPKACEQSLRNLRVSYLDLYLIHWPVTGVDAPALSPPTSETWQAMENLVDAKRVRSIGVSNFSRRKLRELCNGARVQPAVNQVELHPMWRQVRARLRPERPARSLGRRGCDRISRSLLPPSIAREASGRAWCESCASGRARTRATSAAERAKARRPRHRSRGRPAQLRSHDTRAAPTGCLPWPVPPLPRRTQDALLEAAQSLGVHLTAYSPLGSTDSASMFKHAGGSLLTHPTVMQAASSAGKSPAQVLIRWAIQRGTSVVPKSVKPERLQSNIDVLTWELSPEQMKALNSIEPQQRLLTGSSFLSEAGPYRTLAQLWDEDE
jgi:diketogulonate reductase-like aldo/keto reductase